MLQRKDRWYTTSGPPSFLLVLLLIHTFLMTRNFFFFYLKIFFHFLLLRPRSSPGRLFRHEQSSARRSRFFFAVFHCPHWKNSRSSLQADWFDPPACTCRHSWNALNRLPHLPWKMRGSLTLSERHSVKSKRQKKKILKRENSFWVFNVFFFSFFFRLIFAIILGVCKGWLPDKMIMSPEGRRRMGNVWNEMSEAKLIDRWIPSRKFLGGRKKKDCVPQVWWMRRLNYSFRLSYLSFFFLFFKDRIASELIRFRMICCIRTMCAFCNHVTGRKQSLGYFLF